MSSKSQSPNVIAGDVSIIGGDITLDNNKAYKSKDFSGARVVGLLSYNVSDEIVMVNAFGNINLMTFTAGDKVSLSGGVIGTGGGMIEALDNGVALGGDGIERSSAAGIALAFGTFDMSLAVGAAEIVGVAPVAISYVDNGVGDWSIAFASPFLPSATYTVIATVQGAAEYIATVVSQSASAITITCDDDAGARSDQIIHWAVFEDSSE